MRVWCAEINTSAALYETESICHCSKYKFTEQLLKINLLQKVHHHTNKSDRIISNKREKARKTCHAVFHGHSSNGFNLSTLSMKIAQCVIFLLSDTFTPLKLP